MSAISNQACFEQRMPIANGCTNDVFFIAALMFSRQQGAVA